MPKVLQIGSTAPAQTRLYSLSELARIAKGETLPDAFKEVRPLKRLRLDAIQTSRFQSRLVLDETHIQHLAQRIQADGLYHPISVRPLSGGQYELLTGQCRCEAYKRLKREVIPALVHQADDKQAARISFYDHLFYKMLSDFEIFKGFQQLLKLEPALSLRAIAQEAGWPLRQVKRVMAFGRLPNSVQAILSTAPGILSAGVAVDLAKQTTRGYGRTVAEAIQRIQQGKLPQHRITEWVHAQIGERLLSNAF